jgi:hypothetical protein
MFTAESGAGTGSKADYFLGDRSTLNVPTTDMVDLKWKPAGKDAF